MGLPRILWHEQHPEAHEQTTLDFKVRGPAAAAIPLFEIKVSQK
ncbi:hypothetical protein GRAN_4930 [Granulicella sibirica]|uniref:Uncharacterized protein n=1 Tax=Granulicella sibirica TaxID=2479048 RepID=A0A4Q0SXQ6_9BACT|nr:hypothetical protein GRAN_4930 [Granulicella sibirica]